MDPVALGCAAALALVHLFARQLHLPEALDRPVWLSAAGGASVAYVFAHLLPELAAHQAALAEAVPLGWFDRHVWLAALVGFAAFYGLERLALRHHPEATPASVFGPHLGAFALYSGVIGLLLHRGDTSGPVAGPVLFAVAMGLHLAVNDGALLRHHRQRYRRLGRWVLAGAVLAGAALGAVVDLPPSVAGAALALLGGAIILNAVKEELPADREGRFAPFVGGGVAYAALLLLAEAF